MQKIKRQEAALHEAPIACLQAMTANMNRDPKKTKPFSMTDFMLFRDCDNDQDDKGEISAETAAAMLDLRHLDVLPSILLVAWKQVLACVRDNVKSPDPLAFHNDDRTVWIVAPKLEGKNIRGGLVAVDGCIHGTIRVRDLNRPLMVHDLIIPKRQAAGWLEAELLLVKAES